MVSGETLKTLNYYDSETSQMMPVELSVRDHILFRLLQQIVGALK